ncbi:MAG TPA: hypothetical protein VGM90_35125 [Kofleriaceae bacterium]|jgi:hypothetical protein
MTKTLATLLTLSLAACGSVEPTGAYGDGDDGSAGDDSSDMGSDQPDGGGSATPDPVPMDAIMLEAPIAATTADAISRLDWTHDDAVYSLIVGQGGARDVSEQRFVTLTDDPIDLHVTVVGTPVIAITRTIVTDVGEQGPAISPSTANRVWCTSNHDTIDLGDPRCNINRPVVASRDTIATSTSATWSVWIYDETSQGASPCSTGATGAWCMLPGEANHAYRIVTAVTNIPELWDGSALAIGFNQGLYFIGHTITQPYCWDYVRDSVSQNFYCNTRYDYTSPVGLDKATMSFSGISVQVTANDMVSTTLAPDLAWSYGDSDFPGPTY